LAILCIYGVDVNIQSVLQKGNFSQMFLEVENVSKISDIYLSTKDCNSYSSLFNGRVRHLSSRLFCLPDNTLGKSLAALLFFIVGFFSFLRRAKEIDVIVSQGTTSLQGAIANILFHKPVILYLQYFAYKEQFLLRRSILAILFRSIELFSVRHCTRVIAPNERLRAEAFSDGAKSVDIIPNFVNTIEIDRINRKNVIKKNLGFDESMKTVLFVGRLHSVKNLSLLLKSFSQLENLSKCVLVLIGDGPEKQRLIRLALSLGIDNKIRFEGFKPKNSVLEYMKAADVLVLPSIVEGQPRVVLEAWASGLPVVASRVNGIENLVTDGFDGLLFDLSSEKQLTEAISKALEKDIANSLRVNAKSHVAQYSENRVLFQQKMIVEKLSKS
jgi:glycosyltransferase involved in cell wall biosynthesis